MFQILVITNVLITAIKLNEASISIESDTLSHHELKEFSLWFLQNASCVTIISDKIYSVEAYIQVNFPLIQTSFRLFNTSTYIIQNNEVAEGYIIDDDNIDVVFKILHRFESYLYKTSTNFLIQLYNETHIQSIFETSITLKLRNLLIIYNVDNTYFIHSYNHFKNKTSRFNINQYTKILEVFYDTNYNGYRLKGSIFDSVPTSLKISSSEYIGLDPMVFRTIAEKLNMNLVWHEPYDGSTFGSRSLNGTATGSILELYNGNTDVTMNQMFLKNYNAPELKFTSTIFGDRLCVVVPKAGKKPDWSAMFSTYSATTWALILFLMLISFITLSVMRIIIRKMSAQTKKVAICWELETAFIDILQIIFNISQSRYSKYNFEKIFLGFMLIFAVVITTSFQGSLVNVIRNPRFYPNIETLEDLDKSGYIITTSAPNLRETFAGSPRAYMQALDKKLFVLPPSSPSGQSYLSRELKVQYKKIQEIATKGRTSFHMVKECPQNYLMSYLTHRDALFYNDFNKFLDLISASGLIFKWHDDFNTNVTIKYGNPEMLEKSSEEPTGFKLSELQTSFYILILGTALSITSFLLEMYKII